MEYRGTLLLGAVPRITVPIAHSLFRKGIPTFSAFFTTEQHPIRSRAIKRSVDLAPLQSSNSQLLDALINVIEDEDIDYLVPCNDSSLHYILRHYDVLSENCTVGCPAPEILLKVLDKSITLSFAKECAIPVPKEIPGSTSIEQIEAELAFPVAVKVKSKVDEGDFKVRYFNTIDELRDTAKSIPHFLDRYFVQEYCPGEGVGVEVLMNEGRPVMIFQHRRVAEHPRSGGVSALAISESPEPRLVDMAVRLLQALRWQGVAMVEFKHDRNTGKTVLMEVNGRYWGSLGLSTACRFDFPYIQWALDHGVAVEIPRDYPVGVKARWTAGVLGNLLNAFDRREEGLSFRSEVGMAISEISPAAKDMLGTMEKMGLAYVVHEYFHAHPLEFRKFAEAFRR